MLRLLSIPFHFYARGKAQSTVHIILLACMQDDFNVLNINQNILLERYVGNQDAVHQR